MINGTLIKIFAFHYWEVQRLYCLI